MSVTRRLPRRLAKRRPVDNPEPLEDLPPFWAAIPDDEISRYGRSTPFDEIARAAGWTVARFLVTNDAREQTRQTMVGYVRRGLGVYIATVDREKIALLVHLNTGYCVSRALDDADILYIADVVDGALTWETADLEAVNAGAKAYLSALEGVGMRCVRIQIFGQPTLVWVRKRAVERPAVGLPSRIEGRRR